MLLDALSETRRMVEQLVTADRLLRSPSRAPAIEAEVPEAAQAADENPTKPPDDRSAPGG